MGKTPPHGWCHCLEKSINAGGGFSGYSHNGEANTMNTMLIILIVIAGVILAGLGFFIMYKFYRKL